MQKSLNWGIIGCGDVVFNKSGPSILQADRSRILGVMRREPAKARPFAEAHSIPLCTGDADAILRHPDVDIVYVATPPVAHKAHVLAAARVGKHVLVEKPMGMSAAEDREMIDACDAAGVELFVAYYRRFHPHVAKMRELVAGGRIGRPVFGQIDFATPWRPSDWRVQPEISGGGLFVDVVSHRLDVMVSLLGDPVDVHGVRNTFNPDVGVEDAVSVAIRFADGALAAVSADFVSGRSADGFRVVGIRGVIETDHLDGHVFTLKADGESERFEFDPFPAPHLGLIRHIERVLAGEAENASSGRAGMQTDRIIDNALHRLEF